MSELRTPGVQRLIEMGRVREQPAQREQVAAVWRKAVESAGDATLPGMSIDGALRSAYDAGHLAALALLAAHGLRPGGGQKGSMYDPVLAGPDELRTALDWMRRTLPAIHRALREADPALAPLLADARR